MRKFLPLVVLPIVAILLVTVGGLSNAAPGKSRGNGGWEPSADHAEFVLITLKSDPTVDPEPACVAIQIGINLLQEVVQVQDDGVEIEVPVVPADEVTLFPTLAGVEIVNPVNDFTELVCDSPAGPETRSLEQLLNRFINDGGEVVVCPLCALGRGILEATYGALGDAEEIHNLFLKADKVIDY